MTKPADEIRSRVYFFQMKSEIFAMTSSRVVSSCAAIPVMREWLAFGYSNRVTFLSLQIRSIFFVAAQGSAVP